MRCELSIKHRNSSPVILLGHGSSGTSIFSRLLREHLGISFGTESQFIIRYYQRLPKYGDLSDDANLRLLIRDLMRERWFARCRSKWGFAPTLENIFSAVTERTYRGTLDAVFFELAKHNNMAPRWGDKTPEYALHLPVMQELFPDAKFIHLVRDGRDVALSVLDRHWGAKNIYTAATDWSRSVTNIDQFASTIPANQFLEIQYEDLLTRPAETFSRVIEFLEIEIDDLLATSLAEKLDAELFRKNFDKWKEKMQPWQKARYERLAGGVLHRHGYQTEVQDSQWQPNWVSRLYWWCENKALKFTYADYWKDNLYKIRLRCRDAWRAFKLRCGSTGEPNDLKSTSLPSQDVI